MDKEEYSKVQEPLMRRRERRKTRDPLNRMVRKILFAITSAIVYEKEYLVNNHLLTNYTFLYT